ncbi:major facilitator superfamily domain-containing protein [Mycena olivaceomarginata]|nr:major facilitator superfamily domain-containing protein [Mycena olivaceomarginata]
MSTGTTPSPTDLERQSTGLTLGCDISDPYLIDWEENDPDNPQNWSLNKRAFVAFEISFLTFSVYIGSAIYVSSIPGLMQEFHVSLTTATLGLTLYILAYGIGAMFLTPLQELHLLGRNPVYMATLFLFVIFQIPTITAKNINTVLAMRFMTGLSGSPALATGPAAVCYWNLGFRRHCGPIIGPIIGGFAGQAESWRWPILELLWISGFSLAFLGLLLPETHGPTILLRRAKRLRALTGNHELRTATNEIDGGKLVYDALVLPLVLSIEPVLLFANIYLGFICECSFHVEIALLTQFFPFLDAVFYLWFEAFPLVFGDIYHFNEGLSGLPLGFLVSGVFTVFFLHMYHIAPRYARAAAPTKSAARDQTGDRADGEHLHPTSVLIFGFASKPSIHWSDRARHRRCALSPGLYLIFQSILMYITTAYPDHGAPVLAGNTYSGRPSRLLFGRAFFRNLGLGPGSAVLAGISFFLMAVYWFLLRYAHILRRRSKYALST